jgi:predicted ATPase with chaperone activity
MSSTPAAVVTDTKALEAPQTARDLGIRRNLTEDLALKTLYLHGELTLVELADSMCVSLGVIDELFNRLRKDQLCEVKGISGGIHRITTTNQGKTRALELMSTSQYAGPVPVSISEYVTRVRAQSVRDADVHEPDVRRAFGHLVLNRETLTQIGTAVVSGLSIFLYGPPGTGKTTIAEHLPAIYHDYVWVPYAVEIDNQIITLYDEHLHVASSQAVSEDHDRRWVLCRRPRIIVGGELTMEMLDLQFNPIAKFYSAPLQMKANNGVLIVDDFGRQRVRPEDLLNRWILPLDRKIDFLTLVGGNKFEIPFDLFVVFATNLDPAKLADAAFLRRIQTKVKIDYVSHEQFCEIFRNECEEFEIAYDAAVVEDLLKVLAAMDQPLRACYPRDVIRHIRWAARYERRKPELTSAAVAQACRNYFLSS